jgi:hypothetical protein
LPIYSSGGEKKGIRLIAWRFGLFHIIIGSSSCSIVWENGTQRESIYCMAEVPDCRIIIDPMVKSAFTIERFKKENFY